MKKMVFGVSIVAMVLGSYALAGATLVGGKEEVSFGAGHLAIVSNCEDSFGGHEYGARLGSWGGHWGMGGSSSWSGDDRLWGFRPSHGTFGKEWPIWARNPRDGSYNTGWRDRDWWKEWRDRDNDGGQSGGQGGQPGSAGNPVPTPVPGAILLFASGFAAMAIWRRNGSRSNKGMK
jgi:hypothetical protein